MEFLQPNRLWLLVLSAVLLFSYWRSLVHISCFAKIRIFAIRILIFATIIVAMSDPVVNYPSHEKQIVLLMDRSASITEPGRKVADDYARRVREESGSVAVHQLEFARDVRDSANASQDDSWRNETNLVEAIRYGLGLVPDGYVPELVLLSDGNETDGDVLAYAETIPKNAAVSVVPLEPGASSDVRVNRIRVPDRVRFGESFNIETEIESTTSGPITINLYRDEFRVAEENVTVKQGRNTFTFRGQTGDQKSHIYTVTVRASGDTLDVNNTLSCHVSGHGRPQILLIDGSKRRPKEFLAALESQEYDIQVRPPSGLPEDMDALAAFDAILFADVPAEQLTTKQMEQVRDYVRFAGGGFFMFGGEDSFGPGGYYKTPIEDILPVTCDFTRKRNEASVALALVIDRSGSMTGTNLELAKQAARDALALLKPSDYACVLAFDSEVYKVVPVQNIVSAGLFDEAIGSLDAGGGTNMYPAMTEATEQLRSVTAKVKHMILLTDGHSTPGDFTGAVNAMTQNGITFSTVGIGSADQALLESLSQQGRGRHYPCESATAIPRIFTDETTRATGSALREIPFQPVVVTHTDTFANIAIEASPLLLGWNATRAKATSQVILATEQGDPLLAWWRYGLGMSGVFTSDIKSRWSAEWLAWPEFSLFWSQTLRHILRSYDEQAGQVTLREYEDGIVLAVDLTDASGNFQHGEEVKTEVVTPDGGRREYKLTESSPGHYTAQIDSREPGVWIFRTSVLRETQGGSKEETLLPPVTHIVGYPRELQFGPADRDKLERLALKTGGAMTPAPNDLTRPDGHRTAIRSVSLWPFLLPLAIFLYLIELLLRRLGDFRLPLGIHKKRISMESEP
ncbi:MAG: VWA domain-containing protein [Planctomycetia bacterium]|nr:VWA domain-containing protein [Planctomycetia bacterium]